MVISGATHERVVARDSGRRSRIFVIAIEGVVVRAPIQIIVAATSEENILSFITEEPIIAS